MTREPEWTWPKAFFWSVFWTLVTFILLLGDWQCLFDGRCSW